IQNLVFNELVFITQAILIQDSVLIDHDGVIDAATLGQPLGTQIFDFMHKSERSGAIDFLYKRSAGEINRGIQLPAFKNRTREIDSKRNLETIEGQQSRLLVSIGNGCLLFNTNEFFGRVLFLNASGLDKEYKRTGAAIHNRDFIGAYFNDGIVDTKPRH